MSQFDHEEKLVWELEQLPGVLQVDVKEAHTGAFRVNVQVAPGEVDAIWEELVQQVDAFERSLAGEAGLDLEVQS